jgi:hypothetical protein
VRVGKGSNSEVVVILVRMVGASFGTGGRGLFGGGEWGFH